ncbi:hypothetical protein BsWGS_12722 [Bradybaena similaris]
MCRVLSKPREIHHTQRSENTALNKFDVVWFLHKVVSSTANNPSPPAAENVTMENTTKGNKNTTEEATTNMTKSNQAAENKNGKGKIGTLNRSKRETQKWNSDCRCQIQSDDSVMITIIKVWSQPDGDLKLQINSTTNLTSVQINDTWRQLFVNTPATVSIADEASLSFYTVIMDVTGNSTRVTCTESGNQPTDEKKATPDPVINANAELLFEAPLLVIGAVMAVIGFLLLIAAISVWRRYRQEGKRQARLANDGRESSTSTGCNYEMITLDQEPHRRSYSTADNESSLRKVSLSVAHSEHHRKVSLTPISTHPQAVQPIIKSPSPGAAANKTKAFDWAMKGKHNSHKKNKYEADKDEGDYSEVEPEDKLAYEDLSTAPVPSARRGTGVATPLAFIKPGEHHPLKKTDYLNQANAKTRSQPPKELNEDNTYSHLDRLGHLRSHCLLKQNCDHLVSNNAGICHTIEVRNSTDVLNVNMNSSDKPTEVTHILKDIEGMVTSVVNSEEQNHIYEAIEKQDCIKGQQGTLKPTKNGCVETQPKYVNTPLSKEKAGAHHCDSKLTTNEVNQSDLKESKCQDSDSKHNVGEGEQIAETEIIHRKHKEMNLDKTCKPSSMVTDNRASERPMIAARQSDARFQHDLTEAQTNTRVTTTSETDSENFNNSDMNDKPQIIEVIKDRQETKSLSKYVNIQPVDRTMNVDRQFNVTNVTAHNENKENARTSNKNSDGTNDKTDMAETEETVSVNQPHADLRNTLLTDRRVSINRNLSASDQVNPNNTQGDARVSYKRGNDTSGGDLQESDATLLHFNLPETSTATTLAGAPEAKQDDCCTDDDDLKGYTIFENIVYESSSDTEL